MCAGLSMYIDKLSFRCGTEVPLDRDTILVIVGPNNSGKSATLADIRSLISDNQHNPAVLDSIHIHRRSTVEEIKRIFQTVRRECGSYNASGMHFHESNITQWWQSPNSYIGPVLAKYAISDLTTRVRLSDAGVH